MDGRNNKAPSIAGGALGLLRWIYLRQKHHDPPMAVVVVVRVRCSAQRFMPPIMLAPVPHCQSAAQVTYCAMPFPNDQFSFFTSIRLMNTSSRRTASSACRLSAMVLNSSCFFSTDRPSLMVI
ncbi:hypothetical protein SAMN05216496_3811 [Pseudomonas sp. Z003-0.4C(8344-21)]|nr:hypothetical protein SAMN05216496_3811 [Pseudomonas sp. Z003-0.4C(8344-21)]